MMISPDAYYDEYLKGKNEKQLLTAIRGLKQEMGKLRNALEQPDDERTADICPNASTRLWCTRMYLDRAKQALIDAGGVYTPSKAEMKAQLFEASIPAIIRVVFRIGGFFEGYETRTITLDAMHLHFEVGHSLMLEPSGIIEPPDFPCGKDEFLGRLRELHIGEWRSSYFNPNILDGTQWELAIEFSDGHKPFQTGGSNAYPYNFREFQELVGIDMQDDKCNDELMNAVTKPINDWSTRKRYPLMPPESEHYSRGHATIVPKIKK